MSEDALGTQIFGVSSSRCVGLSRMMLGWVGVEIGVKIEVKLAASSTGDVASVTMGGTASPDVYAR